jgi:MYXO-CTERM domain-containing protein
VRPESRWSCCCCDLFIGIPDHPDDGGSRGTVFVLRGRTGGWPSDLELDDADAVLLGSWDNDEAGSALAASGDVDGDGLDDLLVGLPGHDGGGANAGAAQLVRGSGPRDLDGDGVGDWDGDCDDADPTTYAGAPELCDGRDDDCNGLVDDGLTDCPPGDDDDAGGGDPGDDPDGGGCSCRADPAATPPAATIIALAALLFVRLRRSAMPDR